MHVNYSYSEIYQYLVSRGHGLSNESVLKEPENNANVIWGIFVALSKVVESSHIKSTFTLLSHEIEEPQHHNKSMQWLANVVVLRQLFRKLKIDFMIMNFFKPEKERTHYLLNRMVAVCQWAEKVRKSNDEILTAFNQSMKDLEKARVKLAQSQKDLEALQAKKDSERAAYQEKQERIQGIKANIIKGRIAKLEKTEYQKNIEEDLARKHKNLEAKRFENANKNYEIASLRRQVSSNAPQLKKEKLAICEALLSLQQSYKTELKNLQSHSARYRQSVDKDEQFQRKKGEYVQVEQLLAEYRARKEIIEEHRSVSEELEKENRMKIIQLTQLQEKVKKEKAEMQMLGKTGMEIYNASEMTIRRMEDANKEIQQLQPKIVSVRAKINSSKQFESKLMSQIDLLTQQTAQKIQEIANENIDLRNRVSTAEEAAFYLCKG